MNCMAFWHINSLPVIKAIPADSVLQYTCAPRIGKFTLDIDCKVGCRQTTHRGSHTGQTQVLRARNVQINSCRLFQALLLLPVSDTAAHWTDYISSVVPPVNVLAGCFVSNIHQIYLPQMHGVTVAQ